MLQQEKPDDYVIAINEAHSVKRFVEEAFRIVNLDYIKPYKRFLRPLDVDLLIGDYSKANRALGWEPKVKFDGLVEIMVKEDLRRWERWLKGEHFPWDAPSYQSEAKILTRSLKA